MTISYTTYRGFETTFLLCIKNLTTVMDSQNQEKLDKNKTKPVSGRILDLLQRACSALFYKGSSVSCYARHLYSYGSCITAIPVITWYNLHQLLTPHQTFTLGKTYRQGDLLRFCLMLLFSQY